MASTSESELDPFARPAHLAPVRLADLDLDSGLASVPVDYTLKKLDDLGPSMLEASAKCSIDVPPPSAPPSQQRPSFLRLSLPAHFNQSLRPTHVLAVSGFDNPSYTLLQPVFGLVRAPSVFSVKAKSTHC